MTSSPAPDAWVACPKPNSQATLRLFCFPYAGAGVPIFRSWPDGISITVEVCLIQLPGRGTRLKEAPYTRLSPLVQSLARALRKHLDRPFAFFGHSLGALVSFELARHLRQQHDVGLVHLFVSGCGAPDRPNTGPPIHALPEPAFLEELRRLNGTPKAVLDHTELMQLMLPTLRADFAICETYVYAAEPPLDCPISVYGGLQDDTISRDRLEAWRGQTSASFSLEMFPGDHFFLHSAQPLLLQALSRELRKIETTSARGLRL